MKNHFTRKLSLLLALVMILTMVMSVAAFADSLENVPILDNDSGQEIGRCGIEYTANQVVSIDDENDTERYDDIEITVARPEEGTKLIYTASENVSDGSNISWQVRLLYQDNSARTIDGTQLSDHLTGDGSWISGYDYSQAYQLTAHLYDPIEGIPDSFSTGLYYFRCPTTTVDQGPYANQPILANHGEAFNSQQARAAVIPVEEEAVTYTGSNPGASEAVSPSGKALDNLKWALNHWATILQGMSDDQLSMMFKDVGVDVDLRGITVLDSQAVLLMKQNNNVVPLNITITFQGKPFVCQIPVGFNFKKFEKSDGSIVIAEIIWELISKQYGLM